VHLIYPMQDRSESSGNVPAPERKTGNCGFQKYAIGTNHVIGSEERTTIVLHNRIIINHLDHLSTELSTSA